MKKMISLLLAMLMVLSLAACGDTGAGEDVPQITIGSQQNDDKTPEAETSKSTEGEAQTGEAEKGYAFLFQDVKLQPGTAFDAAALPEASSVYTVPSCALEGTDNVYNYDDLFEVTAYNEGKGEFIYSVYFIDPNLKTPEGLAIGDSVDTMTDLYGDGYTQESAAYAYTKGNTQLIVIAQDGVIISIEYRLLTA